MQNLSKETALNPVTPRLYFIGAGVIARISHGATVALLPHPDTIPIRVADPNPAAVDEFKKLLPRAVGFADYQQMLASEPARDTDIVIVATPPFLHAPMTLAALRSGRHVLCEKPLAMTRAEGHEMLRVAREQQRWLGCCSMRVAGMEVNARVREMIAAGQLGELYHATARIRYARARMGIEGQPGSRWFVDKSKNGGGPVADWGPYEFAVLNDVLRPTRVEVLHAWLARPETQIDPTDCVYDVEVHAGATLRYSLPGDAQLTLDYDRASCTHGEETNNNPITFQIEGTRGALRWEWITDGGGRIWHSYDAGGKHQTELIEVPQGSAPGLLQKPLVFFQQRVLGADSPAFVNETALFNFEVLRAIYDCAESGRPQTITRGEQ